MGELTLEKKLEIVASLSRSYSQLNRLFRLGKASRLTEGVPHLYCCLPGSLPLAVNGVEPPGKDYLVRLIVADLERVLTRIVGVDEIDSATRPDGCLSYLIQAYDLLSFGPCMMVNNPHRLLCENAVEVVLVWTLTVPVAACRIVKVRTFFVYAPPQETLNQTL